MAAFLVPKVGGAPSGASVRTVPTTEEVWRALSQGAMQQSMTAAPEAARQARAFHWPLEFPDIMERGGFNVVLGNPPWEVMQLSDKEYFAARHPEIAALAGAARKRAIDELEGTDPAAFQDFIAAKHMFDATNQFARESGRFDLTARGKVNTYSLFAELFTNLARDRAGVIVPTGIATDATTAPFFAALVGDSRLAQLVDFENRAPLFSSVHRSYKFCLLTLGFNEGTARFAFFLTDPAQLAEPERSFTLSPEQIAAINPNTRTAPVFRSRADAELTAKIYANAPVLIEEGKGREGNPWQVEFRQGLFNMTSDSGLFRTAQQLAEAGFVREGTDWVCSEPYPPPQGVLAVERGNESSLPLADGEPHSRRYVPLYEAKMIHQFDHRWAGYAEDGSSLANISLTEKQDPACEPFPRYWVPEKEVNDRLAAKGWSRGWLMGWRDIARATDERTVIFSLLPRTAVGHTMPIIFSGRETVLWLGLLGSVNSMLFDFVARQAVGGTHLTYSYLKQFPILPPDFYAERRLIFLVPKVLELTYTSKALAPFARDLGHDGPPFAWDEERRAYLRADLDAFYARAYGLTRDELRYILEPADVKGP